MGSPCARSWITAAAVVWAGIFPGGARGQTGGGLDVQTAGHGESELIFLSGPDVPTGGWDHVVARFEVAYRCHVVAPTGGGSSPGNRPMRPSPTPANSTSSAPCWSATAPAARWRWRSPSRLPNCPAGWCSWMVCPRRTSTWGQSAARRWCSGRWRGRGQPGPGGRSGEATEDCRGCASRFSARVTTRWRRISTASRTCSGAS